MKAEKNRKFWTGYIGYYVPGLKQWRLYSVQKEFKNLLFRKIHFQNLLRYSKPSFSTLQYGKKNDRTF